MKSKVCFLLWLASFIWAVCYNPFRYDVMNSVKGMTSQLLSSVTFFSSFRISDTVPVSTEFQAAWFPVWKSYLESICRSGTAEAQNSCILNVARWCRNCSPKWLYQFIMHTFCVRMCVVWCIQVCTHACIYTHAWKPERIWGIFL